MSVEQPVFEAMASRQLTSWLAEQRLSLAFTTYQTGKLFSTDLQADERLLVFERAFKWCMFKNQRLDNPHKKTI